MRVSAPRPSLTRNFAPSVATKLWSGSVSHSTRTGHRTSTFQRVDRWHRAEKNSRCQRQSAASTAPIPSCLKTSARRNRGSARRLPWETTRWIPTGLRAARPLQQRTWPASRPCWDCAVRAGARLSKVDSTGHRKILTRVESLPAASAENKFQQYYFNIFFEKKSPFIIVEEMTFFGLLS